MLAAPEEGQNNGDDVDTVIFEIENNSIPSHYDIQFQRSAQICSTRAPIRDSGSFIWYSLLSSRTGSGSH